jgi:hypothetical protein
MVVIFLARIANAREVTMGFLNRTQVALALLLASSQTVAVAQPHPSSTAKCAQASSMIRVATIVDRIEHDRQDIDVYDESQPLNLPWFSELAIAVPGDRHLPLDCLQGKSVILVRDDKSVNVWALYSNEVAFGDEGLPLADNMFRVRKVILCTSRHAIELRMGGWVYRLKPGQVLLVLG